MNDSTGLLLGVVTLVAALALYVWVSASLAAVFRKAGEEGWKGWVPILNQVVLLRLGGFSGWLLLLALVPGPGTVAVWVILVVAAHRIGAAFGFGAGMTVCAALLLPVWASIIGFGSARWVGDPAVARPRRGGPVASARETAVRLPPPLPLAPSFGTLGDPPADVPPPAPPPPVSPAAGRLPAAPLSAPPPLPSRPPAPPPESSASDSAPASPRPPASAPRPAVSSAAEADEGWAPPPAPTASARSRELFAPPQPPAEWGGFDLGAVSELTSEVTEAAPGAPAPVAALSTRPVDLPPEPEAAPEAGPEPAPARGGAPGVPLVTRAPVGREVPPGARRPEPWAPARSPMPDSEGFPEASGPVSAIAGAPVAGGPRSARSSVSAVSAIQRGGEVPDDGVEETVIARRRRTRWTLVPPVGPAVPIVSDVLLLGRKPEPDGDHPRSQLVVIADDTVSKTHARLELRDDRWYITDLHSTNGVLFATLMGTEVEATPGEETEAGERFLLGDAEVRMTRDDT